MGVEPMSRPFTGLVLSSRRNSLLHRSSAKLVACSLPVKVIAVSPIQIPGPSHNWDSYPCVRAKTQTVLPDTPSSPVAYAVFSLHRMSTSCIVNNLVGDGGLEPPYGGTKNRCFTNLANPQ